MTTIAHLPDPVRIEEEAAAWIARLYADDVAPEDLTRFEAWRNVSTRHAQAFEALSATVSEVRRAGHIVRAVSFGNAMNASARPNRGRRVLIAAAATVASMALAIALFFATVRDTPPTLFQTAIGEHASVELPDGSMLELNSNSLARVEYKPDARIIRLARGEAFFKVAHQPLRPFWVVARDSWIRAVGTAFTVDLRPSEVHVIVSEGTIKVATARSSNETPSDASLALAPVSILTAGQQAQMSAGSAEIRTVAPVDLSRVSAWRKGTVYFENQPLEAVIEELSRYTNEHMIIEDEDIRTIPIGGTFQANAQGVDTLLNMLESGLGLHVRRESGDRIYIENPR